MYSDDKRDGPHFPSTETLQSFQAFQGLGDRVLNNCVVKEIILNSNQSEKEQQDIIAWHHEKMVEDNDVFPYSPLSLDVEQVCCTLKDVLQLGGQQSYKKSAVTLSDRPRDEHF